MSSATTSPSSFRKPTYVVSAKTLLLSNPTDLWNYRDLFFLLTKRDFLAAYKQTVLGPIWFFVQPFFASLVFSVVFGMIVRVSTGIGILYDRFYHVESLLQLRQPSFPDFPD
jgi:hypothetical protein